MPMSLLPQDYDGQVDQLKRFQQGFRRRTTGGAFGIACIQARQAFVLVCQGLAAPPLQYGQDAQAKREQVDEARRPLVTLHVHGGERERLAFQPAKPALHQVFFAVGQDESVCGG
jgi:hypothetical protein